MTNPIHPAQPIIVDDLGTVRFMRNPIVRWVLDSGLLNMNHIAANPTFTDDDRRQFAQLIGYSVSGYGDLSYGETDPRLNDFDHAASIVAASRVGAVSK